MQDLDQISPRGKLQHFTFPQCPLHPHDATGEPPSNRHEGVTPLLQRCDVMMYAHNKPRGCSMDTPFPDTRCHIPLPAAGEKDKFSLEGLCSLRAFTHTPLSWEPL